MQMELQYFSGNSKYVCLWSFRCRKKSNIDRQQLDHEKVTKYHINLFAHSLREGTSLSVSLCLSLSLSFSLSLGVLVHSGPFETKLSFTVKLRSYKSINENHFCICHKNRLKHNQHFKLLFFTINVHFVLSSQISRYAKGNLLLTSIIYLAF